MEIESSIFQTFPKEEDLVSLSLAGSSKGNQRKYISKNREWYYKQNFYYQNKFWRDDLVEAIASLIGNKYVTLSDCETLQQFSVLRFGKNGVFSRNFLKENEEYIPFGRLLSVNNIDIHLNQKLDTFRSILHVYEEVCNIDATGFLIVQSFIDFLVGNEDRHLYNFGVIKASIGYRLHPIFDFGLGMFEHDRLYDDYNFRDKLEHMRFRTFCKSQFEFILELMNEYPGIFSRLTQWQLHPSEFTFPSNHAETYLRNACGKVGIVVCND